VRELHERLAALGLLSTGDAVDAFGDGTVAVVEGFQRSRGLPITGEVDATTWTRLLEAGWRLGQRLLFFTHPNLRGDDVAELQVRLAQLGFNPGRIDGIFGKLLEEALSDFQRNCALEPSAALTRATLLALVRMKSNDAVRSLVNDARDMAGFDDEPSGPLILCGQSPLAGLLARVGVDSMDVTLLSDESPDVVAAYANANGAAAVLSVQTLKHLDGVHLHYWASYLSHSRRGEQLASAIAAALARSQQLPRVEVTGMALPILRETKMTTLHIEHGVGSEDSLEDLAKVISATLAEVFHRQP
jgi:N-acetylmuramoyl-L-alanine amidase